MPANSRISKNTHPENAETEGNQTHESDRVQPTTIAQHKEESNKKKLLKVMNIVTVLSTTIRSLSRMRCMTEGNKAMKTITQLRKSIKNASVFKLVVLIHSRKIKNLCT